MRWRSGAGAAVNAAVQRSSQALVSIPLPELSNPPIKALNVVRARVVRADRSVTAGLADHVA